MHRSIREIANSRCLVWFMPANKVVWALILFHLFHNRERKQERSWIILERQDLFSLQNVEIPISLHCLGDLGFMGRQVTTWIWTHVCSSAMIYPVRLLRLERNQGRVRHCSQ